MSVTNSSRHGEEASRFLMNLTTTSLNLIKENVSISEANTTFKEDVAVFDFEEPGLVELTFEITLLVLMSIFGSFMNAAIMFLIMKVEEAQKAASALMLNLAITDFIQCIFVVPFNLYGLLIKKWDLGNRTCILQHALISIPYIVSFWCHLGLAAHRFVLVNIKSTICQWLASKRVVYTYILLVWVIQIGIHVGLLYHELAPLSVEFLPPYGICLVRIKEDPLMKFSHSFLVVSITMTIDIWVPFFGCLVSYILIHRFVRRQVNIFPNEASRVRYAQMTRYTNILFCLFCVCWLPDYLRILFDAESRSPVWVVRMCSFAVYFNSTINPYIYALRCEPMKVAFRKYFPFLNPMFSVWSRINSTVIAAPTTSNQTVQGPTVNPIYVTSASSNISSLNVMPRKLIPRRASIRDSLSPHGESSIMALAVPAGYGGTYRKNETSETREITHPEGGVA